MSDELLPCPFCNGTDLHITSNQVDMEYVFCESRGCEGPSAPVHECMDGWNTRTEADTLRARVAELEAVLRSIADDWSGEVEWPGGDEEEAASYASRASAALKE